MKDQLQEAAEKVFPDLPKEYTGREHDMVLIKQRRASFVLGCKSEAAKAYHQQWIPVTERLPEERGRYLCFVQEQEDLGTSKYVWNCYFGGPEYGWADDTVKMNVTHWMPLPEPPNNP